VPFDFLRRRDAAEAESEPPPGARSARFDCVTDEWRIVGRVELEGRLSDLVNRREPIQVSDVSWVALEGSDGTTEAATAGEAAESTEAGEATWAAEPTEAAEATDAATPPEPAEPPEAGVPAEAAPSTTAAASREVDPYDAILILAGEDTLPPQSTEERMAHRVHKLPFNLSLEVPPFRVVGTVYLFPGTEPEQLLDRARDMFVPVVRAVAFRGERALAEEPVDAILVNRFYLRGLEQVDSETGAPIARLPG
jgi:hypothetical protein